MKMKIDYVKIKKFVRYHVLVHMKNTPEKDAPTC